MENIQAIADKSAIALSVLCALHCLLLPAAIVLYPSTLGFLPGDESVHLALLFGVIPISAHEGAIGVLRANTVRRGATENQLI